MVGKLYYSSMNPTHKSTFSVPRVGEEEEKDGKLVWLIEISKTMENIKRVLSRVGGQLLPIKRLTSSSNQ